MSSGMPNSLRMIKELPTFRSPAGTLLGLLEREHEGNTVSITGHGVAHTEYLNLNQQRCKDHNVRHNHISLCTIHGYTVHQRYHTIYSETNAYNVKNVELLKQFKIREAAPTCFGLQGNHHQGATAST